jgi:hypothetical protein
MEDLKLTVNEEQYYTDIFEFSADDTAELSEGPTKAVSANMVKDIFMKSGVENMFLKEIWKL